MKVIGIIPARYNSSRFKGKPLALICGKPMIWWVYNQVRKSKKINEVIVATDDERIYNVCIDYGINVVITSKKHSTSTERLNEVANSKDADLYIAINGDEPLIDPNVIDSIIPDNKPTERYYVSNLMTEIKNPVEALDFTNIKVVTDVDGYALMFSRSMIPYPKSSIEYNFYKHVGVILYTKDALSFFASTSKGNLEKIEDINELRFIEHGIKIKMIKVVSNSLSVDTKADLSVIEKIIQNKINIGEISIKE